jgi:hypothetical protein
MKTLLLHVKYCPSNSDHTTCPEQIQGCTQARKLLAHYRRCREIRSLKRTSYHTNHSTLSLNSALSSSSHSPCLICSLLARHARNVMESTSAASTLASIGSSPPPTVTSSCLPITLTSSRSMPPPPPRPRTCSLGSMPQHPTLLGSTALAQIVPLPSQSFSTTPTNTTTTTTNSLGKNNTIKSSSLARRGRPRATSLDDHHNNHYHKNLLSKNHASLSSSFKMIRGTTAFSSSSSDIFQNYYSNHKDPTLEFGILDRVRNKEPSLSSINEVELSNSLSS